MANEFTFTGKSGDIGVAEIISREIHENLYDGTYVWSLATFRQDLSGTGAQQVQIAKLSRGQAMAAANTNETTAIANTAVSTGSYTIAIAVQELAYAMTDLARALQPGGWNIPLLVSMLLEGAQLRRNALFCTLADSASTVKGSTGVVLDVDTVYEAQYAATIGNVPAAGGDLILKPKALTEFQESLRSEGGAIQYTPQMAQLLSAKGQGIAGSWNGMQVWSVPSVIDDATDYSNMLHFPGATAYAQGDLSVLNGDGAVDVPVGSSIRVELDRTATTATSAAIGRDLVGFAEQEDARYVKILSAV
jgi:hypothetical protein